MSTHLGLTKRELREQRRAERVAAEQAEAAAARRTRTWRLLAAAGIAVVVVAIAAAVSASGGKSDAARPPAQASTLLDGIQEKDGVLGDPKAPLTVTEYVDLQCPACAAASKQTLPTLIEDYVRTGKVKLQARTLHFIGPDSVRTAAVAAGAEQQGKLWPFLEAFYSAQGEENSGYVSDEFLRDVAKAAGVDADAALAAADTTAAQEHLNRANRDAQALGVNSTPTFSVARGDGKAKVLASGAQDPQALAAALDKELAR